MTRAVLAELIRDAASDVLTRRGLDRAALPAVTVRRQRDPARGDYATPIALEAARSVGVAPRELAGWLADELSGRDGVAGAEAVGPGFVNLRLAPAARGRVIAAARAADMAGVRAVPVPDGLVAAIGSDGARYAAARGDTEIDVGRWTRRTDDNPLYLVQFAHARLAGVVRHACAIGFGPGDAYELLTHVREVELIAAVGELPEAAAADVAGVVRYLEELAPACHRFVDACRVLPMGDEEVTDLHRARLALCDAARHVLAGGLGMLGVTAPERL